MRRVAMSLMEVLEGPWGRGFLSTNRNGAVCLTITIIPLTIYSYNNHLWLMMNDGGNLLFIDVI